MCAASSNAHPLVTQTLSRITNGTENEPPSRLTCRWPITSDEAAALGDHTLALLSARSRGNNHHWRQHVIPIIPVSILLTSLLDRLDWTRHNKTCAFIKPELAAGQ